MLVDLSARKQIIDAMKKAATKHGCEVYIVGGAVRDMLSRKKSIDLDFVVIGGDYQLIAKSFAALMKSHAVPFKDNFRIPYKGDYIDVSAPRGETIQQDLQMRDFTVNNLACTLDGYIIGNRADLDARVIRPVHDKIFDHDPLRILRGFRQAATLGFSLSQEFITLAAEKMPLLPKVAGERIYDELRKLSKAKLPEPKIYQTAQNIGLWKTLTGVEPDIEKLIKIHSTESIAGKLFTEEERFILFLAVLYGENPDKNAMEALHPSRNVFNAAKNLLTQAQDFMKNAADNADETVWKHRKTARLMLPYVRIYYDFDIAKSLAALNKIAQYKGALVQGEDVLAPAAEIAPQMRPDAWVADIIEDTNCRLTFGRLKDKNSADGYIKDKINELCKIQLRQI